MRLNYHIMKTDIGIIDIEASGLHFDSYPIEVAILRQGICKSWLIKPEKTGLTGVKPLKACTGLSAETFMRRVFLRAMWRIKLMNFCLTQILFYTVMLIDGMMIGFQHCILLQKLTEIFISILFTILLIKKNGVSSMHTRLYWRNLVDFGITGLLKMFR